MKREVTRAIRNSTCSLVDTLDTVARAGIFLYGFYGLFSPDKLLTAPKAKEVARIYNITYNEVETLNLYMEGKKL